MCQSGGVLLDIPRGSLVGGPSRFRGVRASRSSEWAGGHVRFFVTMQSSLGHRLRARIFRLQLQCCVRRVAYSVFVLLSGARAVRSSTAALLRFIPAPGWSSARRDVVLPYVYLLSCVPIAQRSISAGSPVNRWPVPPSRGRSARLAEAPDWFLNLGAFFKTMRTQVHPVTEIATHTG